MAYNNDEKYADRTDYPAIVYHQSYSGLISIHRPTIGDNGSPLPTNGPTRLRAASPLHAQPPPPTPPTAPPVPPAACLQPTPNVPLRRPNPNAQQLLGPNGHPHAKPNLHRLGLEPALLPCRVHKPHTCAHPRQMQHLREYRSYEDWLEGGEGGLGLVLGDGL